MAASNALPPRSRTAAPIMAARGCAEATIPRTPRASGNRVSEDEDRQAPSWAGFDWLMPAILRDPGRLREPADLAEGLPGSHRGRSHDIDDLAREGRARFVEDRAERVRQPPEEPAR